MATTIYGSTMQSTWRSYLTYEVIETPTDYTINVTDIGIKLVGTTYWITYCDRDATCSFKLGSTAYSLSEYFGDIKKTESWKDLLWKNPESITINKTASPQSVAVSFAITMPKWTRMKGSSGTDYGSTTSTASVTLTVSAFEKPKVTLSAIRDTGNETKAVVTASISSFEYDVISSIEIECNGTVKTLRGGTVGSSCIVSVNTTFENLPIGQVISTVKATGRGGSSDTYTYKIPSAFYTMDIGGKGKEVAFGCPAIDENLPEAGLFRCAMETDFEKDVKTDGDVYAGGEVLATLNKLKKMLSNAYQETLTITNGTFTNNGTSLYLVGNSLRLYMSGTANAAKSAGNIANETMMTIKFKDDKILSLYAISSCGATSGPNSQIVFGVSKSDDYFVITVILAAIGQDISKGGTVNAYVALPVLLNFDAY